MKKLSRNEMKNVFGGKLASGGDGDGGITCGNGCVKWVNGNISSGTCSKKTSTIGGVPVEYCECSVSGGSGCS